MIFNSLQFDGDNSLDHGVYITGEAIYSAPVRDTESIEIPGRNGDFILDKGRWKNIDVTYKVGLFGSDQENFADKIRTYRNILASRLGYKRITDTYNPNEFRLGKLKDGLDVETKSRKKAGEFDIVFDCKPQRFLVSGEAEIEVVSGQTLTNPTAYEASPLLEIGGSGVVNIGDYSISINAGQFGDIKVLDAGTLAFKSGYDIQSSRLNLDTSRYNSGDEVTIGPIRFNAFRLRHLNMSSNTKFTGVTVDTGNAIATMSSTGEFIDIIVTTSAFSLPSNTYHTESEVVQITTQSLESGTVATNRLNFTISVNYGSNRIWFESQWNPQIYTNIGVSSDVTAIYPDIMVNSTKSYLGDPTYIDCEIGEVYEIRDGVIRSLNRYIDLGPHLPVLAPGDNEITYPATITSLKIVPRWYIL